MTQFEESGHALMIDGAAGFDLALGEGALHIHRLEEPARIVPLRRIGRVLLRQPRSLALKALVELAERGVPVHFQDGRGRVTATLISTDIQPTPAIRELVCAVETRDPRGRYCEWLNNQLRHAISRILRAAPAGSVELIERQLQRYAARGLHAKHFAAVWNEIAALSYAWVDGELTRQRLRPLADALAWHDCHLLRDLDRLMAIPLLWQLAPWLRLHPQPRPQERMAFFENARSRLELRLSLHLAALEYQLSRSQAAAFRPPSRPQLRRRHSGAHAAP